MEPVQPTREQLIQILSGLLARYGHRIRAAAELPGAEESVIVVGDREAVVLFTGEAVPPDGDRALVRMPRAVLLDRLAQRPPTSLSEGLARPAPEDMLAIVECVGPLARAVYLSRKVLEAVSLLPPPAQPINLRVRAESMGDA